MLFPRGLPNDLEAAFSSEIFKGVSKNCLVKMSDIGWLPAKGSNNQRLPPCHGDRNLTSVFSGTARSGSGCLPWATRHTALYKVGVLQHVKATQLFALELNLGMPDSCAKACLTISSIQKQCV